jgi:redox-sensitive bicupin YhaK (pirin superfamily)
MSKLELVILPRERDLGGFQVRRILPYASHRMIGPFIFLDHMGPAEFTAGHGMDVRPHPHINLATVTYLFEGSILHRDSLGNALQIEPGAINWMTAGSGIVHSERTPTEVRKSPHRLHGLQCWVALPVESEECAPDFAHHPARSLPEFRQGLVSINLLLGELFGQSSPVRTASDVLYADIRFTAEGILEVPGVGRELALYALEGGFHVNGQKIPAGHLAVAQSGDDLKIQGQKFSRAMILGGAPLPGERHIFWNFVSSSPERIEKAKKDWRAQAFPKIPGDDQEFIPLPK